MAIPGLSPALPLWEKMLASADAEFSARHFHICGQQGTVFHPRLHRQAPYFHGLCAHLRG